MPASPRSGGIWSPSTSIDIRKRCAVWCLQQRCVLQGGTAVRRRRHGAAAGRAAADRGGRRGSRAAAAAAAAPAAAVHPVGAAEAGSRARVRVRGGITRAGGGPGRRGSARRGALQPRGRHGGRRDGPPRWCVRVSVLDSTRTYQGTQSGIGPYTAVSNPAWVWSEMETNRVRAASLARAGICSLAGTADQSPSAPQGAPWSCRSACASAASSSWSWCGGDRSWRPSPSDGR